MTIETTNEIDLILQAIESDELVLPTMPDWAAELQRLLNDPDASTNQIILAVSRDPVLVAQLIKTANSAIYAGMPKVADVMAAVTRLGHRLLHSLIMRITLTKLSNASNPHMQRRLAAFVDHSQQVAAVSYVLAKRQKRLTQDQAMLAGLIHDIGVIPICMCIDKHGSGIDEHVCDMIILKYSGQIGEKLLRTWAFPESLVAVPAATTNLQHGTVSDPASYADLVTVANLLSQPALKFADWDNVHAIKRLGMTTESCTVFSRQYGDEVQSVREIFFDSYL